MTDWPCPACSDSESARLRPCTARRRTAVHQYRDPDPWFICELELQLSIQWASLESYKPVHSTQVGPKQNLETQVWNSLRFSCALWSANLLHQVWRSYEFLVLLLITLLNYKTKYIPFLNQLRSIQLKDFLWVILTLLIEILIQLIWRSANESRHIVVTSLMKIWTWQECLNYLQSHPRHSNYFSKSQSPAALLSLSPDQLFVLSLWLNFWTWQECLNYFQSHPRHSNHFSKSQSPRAQLKFIQDQLFVLFLWLNPWTWQDFFNIWWLHPWHSITAYHQRHNLNPKSFKRPLATRNASLARAGAASRLLIIISEFDDGESFKADPPQLHPPASQRKCPVVPMM